MQQNVGVGVAAEPLVMRDLDTADLELAPGGERMHVQSLPDPHARLPRMASAIATSSGQVTLRFSRLPATTRGLSPSCSTAAASSVGAPLALASACASRPARNICGVCASQNCARSSVD